MATPSHVPRATDIAAGVLALGTDPADGVDPVEVGSDTGVDAGRAGGAAALAPADDAHHLPVPAQVHQGPAAVPLGRTRT